MSRCIAAAEPSPARGAGRVKPPFPYFGGKSRAAPLISARIGDAKSYIEPFAGSLAVLAVLLYRHRSDLELINDLDGYVANFWRATAADPEGVARWADWPMCEADLRARHRWLLDREEFRARILADPAYHDAQIAGWWLWGICLHVGGGWCAAGATGNSTLHFGSCGARGILARTDGHLHRRLSAIATRLRDVKVACGDWRRVLGESSLFPSPVSGGGRNPDHFAGVLLDPPYKGYEDTYRLSGSPAAEAEAWARERGTDPQIRIALCGYEGDYDLPGWSIETWKAKGGYGQTEKAVANSHRERIWFSPACLPGEPGPEAQGRLFDG